MIGSGEYRDPDALPTVRVYRVRYRERFIGRLKLADEPEREHAHPWHERTFHVSAESVDRAQAVARRLTECFYKNWLTTPLTRFELDVIECVLVDEHAFIAKELL